MKLKITDRNTGGDLLLFKDEDSFDRQFFGRDRNNKYFTIAWNRGPRQTVVVDGNEHDFMPGALLPLMFNQSFNFENPAQVIAWQFNREFYCIVDHDKEVSCVGFLFVTIDNLFIVPDEGQQQRLQLLLEIFIEEMKTADNIQNDMVLMLLKRLIILLTKMARSEYLPETKLPDDKFNTLRKFNLLVEYHFKEQHSVSFYAEQLSKSPKTLSNLFALYSDKTPLQVIQERILIEAKKLLLYTDRSVKQITFELGFEDAAYFSNFFKKHTSLSPVDFRNKKAIPA